MNNEKLKTKKKDWIMNNYKLKMTIPLNISILIVINLNIRGVVYGI